MLGKEVYVHRGFLIYRPYMKDLITMLRESGMGCFLFGAYAGCVYYVDDIILLSASLKQLQIICTSYADDNDLLFNNLKLYCMLYGQHANLNSLVCLYICLKPIK